MNKCIYAVLALAVLTTAACNVTGLKPIILATNNGMQVHILHVGATVQRLIIPNQDGLAEDVVLGYDDPQQYQVSVSGMGPPSEPTTRSHMRYCSFKKLE